MLEDRDKVQTEQLDAEEQQHKDRVVYGVSGVMLAVVVLVIVLG